MKDGDKTKKQLINELTEMRQRVAELEALASERKRAEEALRESEERYRTLLESISDSVYVLDREWRHVIVNDAAERFVQIPKETLLGAKLTDLFPGVEETVFFEVFQRVMETQKPDIAVDEYTFEDGRKGWYEVHVYPVPGGILCISRDITERKRAEEALQESEERYRIVSETISDWAYADRVEPNGAVVAEWTTDAITRITGFRPEEVHARASFLDFIHADDHPILHERTQALLSGGSQVNEYRFITKSGEVRWLRDHAHPVWDEAQGHVVRVYGAVQDITERKRAEEALKASEKYTRSIIDSSLDMVITVDVERRIVEFNQAAQETFGYRPEEVIGKRVDILHADPQEPLTVYETAVREGKCVGEILERRKNGEVFPAFLSASVLRDASGEVVGVMGVARDIAERKRAEDTLQRRNRELAMLNRASGALISTLDLDQIIITVLEEVRQLLDVVACSVWLSDPETDELVCQQTTGPQNEVVRGWRLAPGQGLVGWVARSGEGLIVPDVRTDERYFEGVDQQTGLGLRSILTAPLRVKNGVIGVLQVMDTEVGRFDTPDLELLEPLAMAAAMAIENARLYEQARRDAETRSVLLREVNHRVKNNLSAIIGLLYAEPRPAIQDLISRVQSLATVHDLLSASEWEPLSLSELTTQAIHSALQTLPRDKRVSVDVTLSPVRVTSDQAHHLALVINELATNTVKHSLRERDTARIAVRIGLEEDAVGRTVLFEFRDDGPGYPDEVLRLERHSVGFDLIRNIVRKNLHGELSLRNDRGAVATMRFEAEVEVN